MKTFANSGKLEAIRTPTHAENSISVSSKNTLSPSLIDIPNPHSPIITSSGQNTAHIGMISNAVETLLMSAQLEMWQFERLGESVVGQMPYLDGAVVAGHSERGFVERVELEVADFRAVHDRRQRCVWPAART